MVIDSILLTSSDTVRTRQHDDAQSRVRLQAFLGKRARQNVGGSTAKILTSSHVQIASISHSHLHSFSLSLSPSPSPTSQSDHLSHNPPRPCKQASARASKRCQQKKPPTTALSIFGLLRQGLKRRAAFSAASKVIKTRCNNQNRRRKDLPQGPGGEEKKRNTLEMQVTAPLGRTCTYIHVYVRSTKIIPFYRLFLLIFFFFFFVFFFSLCYNGQENVIGTLSLCRWDLLGRCVTATFSSRTMYSGCHSLLSVWENS